MDLPRSVKSTRMVEWGWKSRCLGPYLDIIYTFPIPKQKILIGPPAFQPNRGSYLNYLKTVSSER